MKFPGKRKSKHYFPVEPSDVHSSGLPSDAEDTFPTQRQSYIVGVDQPLVDIEIKVTEELLERYGISVGESVLLDDELAEQLYSEAKEKGLLCSEFAGGAVGNTLHNYTVLSNNRAVLLGTINRDIKVGDYAYRYLCHTSSMVDLSHLKPCPLPMGRALCLVLPNGERSFGISKGCMNHLTPDYVPRDVIKQASLLLLTAFLLRDKEAPLYEATMQAIAHAKEHEVPIILNLGTSFLIEEEPEYWQNFIQEHVNVVAMNESEAAALTGFEDPLLALEKTLEWCDAALLTYGSKGLYLGGYCDRSALRKTKTTVYSKSIPDYNQYEYSRSMRKQDCHDPVAIYSHINPYKGGPRRVMTTNGAGDAALSALLHDIAANHYHRSVLPASEKHKMPCLTYSSISQICKYANRVSYEILTQGAPRLIYGLPEKEDSLEEAYWDK